MSNTYATSSLVSKEALAILVNQLSFTKFVNRDWEDEFGINKGGRYASGDTIYVQKPPRFSARAGKVAVPQGITQGKIPMTVAQAGVDVKASEFDLTLNIADLRPTMTSMMAVIANKIDLDGLTMAVAASSNYTNIQGAPTPSQSQALQSILNVAFILDNNAAPRDGQRAMVLGPYGEVELIPGLQGLFNAQGKLAEQYEDGIIPSQTLGFKFGMDQNVVTLTNGAQPVTGGTVNGASQTGNALTVTALTGNVVVGQKFTLAGVFGVNPQSRQSTGQLQTFTVTAAAASGATSLSIYPAITPTGAFQNVTNSPGASAAMVYAGTVSAGVQANIGFHRDAFTMACLPLHKPGPNGVIDVKTETYKGLTLRMVRFYDGTNDDEIIRFDVLYGWAAPYPELSCVLGG